ncbi:potassium channel family protein [Flavobacterium hydatis]|uniref:Potassium channel domain-containing protein n=1 Tax=Flavobacterium hydatis TaxID=991 RepID=A0A086AER0_FLAHY|nr:potassium channel family protein [Flavobacterium hydatis]KFF15174.1 hypothetical protein IW20_16080 [Flavobacterium hydatis]OXA88667.1 hypothetical protein B0A62_21940 [Flavobacterium hydatis]
MATNKIIIKLISFLENLDRNIQKKKKSVSETDKIRFRKKQHKLNRGLTSSVGKNLESLSYPTIGYLIIGLIIMCAFAFSYFDITGTEKLNFSDAIYFSIVTMTSLGYGDIHPTGTGRLIASIEVLSGVMLVAIFVGKIASERQSTLLLLLYNTESNRQLKEFYREVKIINVSFDQLLDEHEHLEFNHKVKKTYKFITGIYNYLSLHANQGRIADYGNISSLRKLYVSIYDLQVLTKNAIKTHGPDEQTKINLQRLIYRINGIASLMQPFHLKDPISKNILTNINFQTSAYEKSKINNTSSPIYRTKITESLKNKVLAELPPLPWDKKLNVIIGNKLGLPHKFTDRIIKKLVEEGLAPDPRG